MKNISSKRRNSVISPRGYFEDWICHIGIKTREGVVRELIHPASRFALYCPIFLGSNRLLLLLLLPLSRKTNKIVAEKAYSFHPSEWSGILAKLPALLVDRSTKVKWYTYFVCDSYILNFLLLSSFLVRGFQPLNGDSVTMQSSWLFRRGILNFVINFCTISYLSTCIYLLVL